MEELITSTKTMVGEQLRDKKAQSIKEMVEEATKPPPRKSLKKMKGRDKASPSIAQAHERTFSLVTQKKGKTKANTGLLMKTLMTPQKNNGKEKVHKPKEGSHEHIDFHFSNEDVHSLIFLMNQSKRKKRGGKQALERREVDKSPKTQEEASPKEVDKTSKEFLAMLDAFQMFVVQ